jgi:hypothetical protein
MKKNTKNTSEEIESTESVQSPEAIGEANLSTSLEKEPTLFKRNNHGLLPSVNYEFNANGTINWRAMIGKEYLVANRDSIKGQNKDVDISSLPDSQLLILLAGIKDLAQTRGFRSVAYDVVQASSSYVAVKCTIEWIPNFETEMEPVLFSSLADAHIENTKSFAKDYLMAIAENRAFVRAVRNFLRINIVGSDEVGDSNKGQPPQDSSDHSAVSSTHPVNVLIDLMKKTNITFEKVKETLKKEGKVEAEDWSEPSNVPNKVIFELIQRLKKKV